MVSADIQRLVEAIRLEKTGCATRDGNFGFQLSVFGGEGGKLGRARRRGVEDTMADRSVEKGALRFVSIVSSPSGGGFR
jgi:hypothetical protein